MITDDPQITWIMGLENIALCESKIQYQVYAERTKQMEEILNFQKPSEGLELVILLHTQY